MLAAPWSGVAPDLTDPTTLLVLLFLVAFSVYWKLRWQWRAAWFDRVWVERADEREREEE